uniref:Bm1166, isoform b n=1 Tax=Brugia malayi TaxID=6279 RepID=A0A1I9G081_BRUMA|nr:Bm1166, isoform b [Brugia malayi]
MSYVGSFFEGDCREGVTYLIFDTPIAIEPGLHLTNFYSKNINLTRSIQDERQAQYYMSPNIEFVERDHESKKLCESVTTQISDKVSANAYSDDFQDFFDQKSLDETIQPKLPIVVGAGKESFISSYLLLLIFAIIVYFF